MLDDLDIKILNILQENGRTKRSQIADEISMSIPSVSERLHKMEEKDIVQGYFARVNRKKFGYDIMVFILINMESSKHFKTLISKVEKIPEILECHSILGDASHILKVIVKNSESLERLLGDIQSWPGVINTKTYFILSTIKETNKIPI
ncbi:MAG: Lrp/AsnC family transcriptional regulator [Ignavibacterium sp.]